MTRPGSMTPPRGHGIGRIGVIGLVLVGVIGLDAQAASAQSAGDAWRFDLGATLQSLTSWVDPALESSDDDVQGVHGGVVRLKWSVEWTDRAVLEVHERVLASVSASGALGPAGFGVSRRPGRAFDASATWVDTEGTRVVHDFDRIALRLFTGPVDWTIGRQAISWGTSVLFPVADLWAAFSPFELDVEERPGVDGIRALAYPGGVEVDGVLVDRGEDGVSGGVRGSWSGARWEVWGGGGRFWDRTVGLAGVTWLGDHAQLRLEGAVGDATRATLGVDRVSTRVSVSAEIHYNGDGAGSAAEYPAQLASPVLSRGETYYLGRYYGGAAVVASPDDEGRLSLALSVLANLDDRSTAWTPSASYDLGRSARVGVGGLLSTGDRPSLSGGAPSVPILPTEFGAYGRQVFVRISLFY
ncbi:MAG: hypothetical protein KJP18_11835 [Gemmatimonadetes bacterium]|nr:hypothetical protein [Gemmatimonadota bacterium]